MFFYRGYRYENVCSSAEIEKKALIIIMTGEMRNEMVWWQDRASTYGDVQPTDMSSEIETLTERLPFTLQYDQMESSTMFGDNLCFNLCSLLEQKGPRELKL